MSLTKSQKLANQLFFEKLHASLKEGGMWIGDGGYMRKFGTMFVCNDIDTYIYLKKTVPSKWLSTKVLLLIDLTKIDLTKIDL